MTRLINPQWVRPLKMLLTSAFISASIFSFGSSDAVWANPDNNKIATAIQTLKESDQRWIQINLSEQNLIAWEGNKPVYAITISSGKKSTPTRVGTFKIQTKHKKTRMQGRGYNVPNVPHTMYYQGGYAIHGAYWHHKFGTPVSNGCVNLAPNHAKWVFEWADIGTPVVIKK
ncbi:L,D-transpeptidase [Anabaena sp. UHCC 0451]|uniref:L,D-transpeptidase n=1 Tax=Anabaena sp. UHCC 0451 TaxID=2055235 RepID=UPI002B2060F2|nr:L,D-transpeptidase [Anabaena sp. UHCC 0451]MEA5577992.1 L,D-transpeptidase [Anabaena sp. UHCC 0451]